MTGVAATGSPETARCACACATTASGLPAGLDWRQADSLGLRLVQILAGQLRATVEVCQR